ncbi:MAG: mechanosensitive ion channel family protein, partial [Candidatus Onthovivens sp.]
ILRKLFKIDKKLIKDRTIKTFLLSLVKVIANIAIVIIFLLILKVDLTGVAQIFSSAILAVGLSLQDVISNFASGVIILANKPFVVGDYIDLNNGEAEGTVIDVKFLVTALETVDKQIITVPNKNITGSVVKNYSKNPLRRITLNIGVDYSTNIDKAKNVILNIVKNDNRILEEPNPVVFLTAFNDSSLNLSLRCYVPNLMYWDILFSLNEKILLEFRKNDINIPFNRLVVSMTKD